MEPGDGTRLRSLRLAALSESPAAFGSTLERESAFGDEEWAERAAASAQGRDRATWFAERSGRVVGLVGGHRVRPGDAGVELVSMWTAPEARGLGVGRLLVQAVLDWAVDNGDESVSLWVTRGNDPAHTLYRSMGFLDTGDHQALPSDPCRDEVRMTRSVTQLRR